MVDVDSNQDRHDDVPEDYYVSDLFNQLTSVIAAKPADIEPLRIGMFKLLKKKYIQKLIFFNSRRS